MRGLASVVLMSLSVIGLVASPTVPPTSEPAPRGILGRGAWSWFGDPRAVHVPAPRDLTFVGWIGWNGAIEVASYSADGVVRTHAVGRLFHDDHGSPALLVEPDRRLTVFWSGHNGRAMFSRTTLRPEDIRSWRPLRRVPSAVTGTLGFTYPNPVMVPTQQDRLYLFVRGPDWSADYATRSRDGRWVPARRLIVVPGQRPYVKVDSDGRGRIALAFTDGHPRERTTSIYYMTLQAGWLRHADGRPAASLKNAPVGPAAADRVYDGRRTHISSWVWDVAFARGGAPVIVYATFPSPRRHLYWYARFDGRRWVSHLLTPAGPTISPGTIETDYSGGVTLDHADPSVVYLSRKLGTHFAIQRWSTSNGGRSWRHATVVRTPRADDLRPVVPRGPIGPLRLLWLQGRWRSYTSYRTTIDYLR